MLLSFSICWLANLLSFSVFQKAGLTPEVVRKYAPQSHHGKQGTPTMAGAIFSIIAVMFIMIFSPENWRIALTILCFMGVGMYDDLTKLMGTRHGISMRAKFVLISLMSLILMEISWHSNPEILFHIPFVNISLVPPHWFYLVFGVFVMNATSNAMNFTDGIDGLCATQFLILFLGLYFIYLFGHKEMIGLYGACYLMAGVLAFLWFNVSPAKLFMGDTGSLVLGAVVALLYIESGWVLLLPLVGLILVAEVVSVALQIMSFKLTGNRIFKMAPVHHHFELSGWSTSQIVTRALIISVLTLLIGVSFI